MSIDKEKKYNKVSYRLNNIKGMVSDNNSIDSLMDIKNNEETIDTISSDDIRQIIGKKYLDFIETIGQLGGKLLYIKSGSSGHTFKGVYTKEEEIHKPNYGVKIVAYPKRERYGDLFNIKRPENAELVMIKLLSYFVKNRQTPHIVLPITTFNTTIKTFLKLPKNGTVNSKKFDQFVERYNNGEYYENVSILISEWANSGDLLDYLRNNYKSFTLRIWRTLLFQILSVLAIIQHKYPAFRHNDLKANNILVNEIGSVKNEARFKYRINRQNYIVPNIGFQIKLWDFDFACIPGIVDNSKVEAEWTDKINIKPERNRYYDVHYFLNTLSRKGFFPEFWTSSDIPTRVKSFVKRVIPEKYRSGPNVSERGRLLCEDEYLTPEEIIREDSFFQPMRI